MREEDAWGENTTCITGNTSEHSYNADDYRPSPSTPHSSPLPSCPDAGGRRRLPLRGGLEWEAGGANALQPLHLARHLLHRRRHRSLHPPRPPPPLLSPAAVPALISPVAMLIIPKALGPWAFASLAGGLSGADEGWETTPCSPQCEGLLLNFGFKLLFLLLGVRSHPPRSALTPRSCWAHAPDLGPVLPPLPGGHAPPLPRQGRHPRPHLPLHFRILALLRFHLPLLFGSRFCIGRELV